MTVLVGGLKNRVIKLLNFQTYTVVIILKLGITLCEICALMVYSAASCSNCLPTFRNNVLAPSSPFKSPRRKERKPETCNVDSIREGARVVVISRRDDSQ
jgi:hypothetical protein